MGAATAAAFDIERLTDCFEAWVTGAASGYADGRPAPRSFRIDGDAVHA
jgi:hypothetical protein